MPIATGLALGLGIAGAVGGSVVGAVGSAKAAGAQKDAAENSAQLQYKLGQDSLAFQKQEYGDQQKNIAPWLKAGQGAISQLSDLLSPGGALTKQWDQHFVAPTDVTEQNDPGYKFRLSEGLSALNNSAAAKGGLLSGGTLKAINNYAQNDASNEYGNVYNRALGEYQQNYNQFQQGQANQYNRLAGISGAGQQAAGQLSQSGAQAAGNIANINSNVGYGVGQAYQNAGNATASGYAGIANSINSGIGSGLNQLGQYSTLQALLNRG